MSSPQTGEWVEQMADTLAQMLVLSQQFIATLTANMETPTSPPIYFATTKLLTSLREYAETIQTLSLWPPNGLAIVNSDS